MSGVGGKQTQREKREEAAMLKRDAVLAAHIRTVRPAPLDPQSLARSYGLPVDRVTAIITRNGGSIG